MAVDVQQITGVARSVHQLFANNRYGLDFYQREYRWDESHIKALLHDMERRFLDEYNPTHSREDVASYRPYFLGPIVTELRGGTRYLVDGQQRITTLSLLLIYLRQCLREKHKDDSEALQSLILTRLHGRNTFNLDIEEREECLSAIVDGHEFDPDSATDSVRNLWRGYENNRRLFSEQSTRGQTTLFR